MTRQTVPMGRIFGIPIGLDYSWFLIFVLMTWLLAKSYFPAEFKNWSQAEYWGVAAATTVMLFVSVVLHELGHSLVAKSYKIPVARIRLFIFGGVSEITTEAPSPSAEFLIAIAGPVVSVILGFIFLLLERPTHGIPPLFGLIEYLAYINFALAVFNLIPGYPLDGGRVFRAIVWGINHDMRRATIIAANVGRFFGFLFIMFGVWQLLSGNFGGGIWIAFIGWFLESAAGSQLNQVLLKTLIAGHTVGQAMNRHVSSIPANLTLQKLVDDHVFSGGGRSFVVSRGDQSVGLLTLHGLKDVPREQWSTTMAEQAMVPLAQVKTTNAKAELWTALEQMSRDGVNQLPVMSDGRIVGMLSREDLLTFLQTLQEIG
jgi:Zn-dependent protease/CBS domain-containing protein